MGSSEIGTVRGVFVVLYGKKTTGVIRSTVSVGPDGKVRKHWKRAARAADHPAKVLEALKSS